MKNNIYIRIAEPKDAEKVHNLMVKVLSLLIDKSIYVCEDFDFVKQQIETDSGFALCACDVNNDEIIGVFLCHYPKLADYNIGRDIGLDDNALFQVVHMETAAVLPEYRGQGLQVEMFKFAETIIDKGKYHHLLGLVSPYNPPSIKSFEKSGYIQVITKEKYDGRLRHIYHKIV